MKIRLSLFIFISLSVTGIVSAQDINNKVLMTVEGRNVPAGEFVRMYKKSYDPGNAKDLDNYLNQYVVFRMKVADAISEGYDTTQAFKKELQGYRNQLAQNYLTDPDTEEKLIRQAYQRSLTELNCWHILVSCPSAANPDDTLKAWKKTIDIRERILNGEPFEQVARGTSDDPKVKINGGNLGYFTSFQMIMPFEDAAYSLKKGEISEPVRTPYGYHIIKLVDKRPSGGRIKVAHIMKNVPAGTGEKEAKSVEDEINSIYKQLQEGASFSDLASKYSDHKESASKGGELNWFGAGEIINDFAEAALALNKDGDYTKPVRTSYGWHIIKRLEKKAPGSFEESRSYLERKINQSYLNSIAEKSFVQKLKKEYKYMIIPSSYKWFVDNTDTLITKGLSKYDRRNIPGGAIYSFADQQLTNRDFADYIESRVSMIVTGDPDQFISFLIETRSSDHILNYENSIIEKKFPEFRYLCNEFHDGILLFEISGRKVWNKAQDDSAGLKQYYEKNKFSFMTRKGIKAKIYSLKKPDKMKSFRAALKKYSRYPDSDKRLTEKFISKGDTLLLVKEGTWFEGDNKDIDILEPVTGPQEGTINGFPSIIVIDRIIKAEPLPFDDIRGEMISGFQESLENEWIEQLKEKYSVKIDNAVFKEIRKKLYNE